MRHRVAKVSKEELIKTNRNDSSLQLCGVGILLNMPATFVHLLLAEDLLRNFERLDAIPAFSNDIKRALGFRKPFCLLGTVSPDLPYLDRLNSDAEGWANVMHYGGTMDMVRKGLEVLRGVDRSTEGGMARWEKGVAWLFGYLLHIEADVAIHPIVTSIIGAPYDQDPNGHRHCELGQDAWIFFQQKGESLTRVEWLRHSGLMECRSEEDGYLLDPDILDLWLKMLGTPGDPVTAFVGTPEQRHPKNAPDPSDWYRRYGLLMDKFVTAGGRFPLLLRRVLTNTALVYPEPGEVERRYVRDIRAGTRAFSTYAEVFDYAVASILESWTEAAQALTAAAPTAFARANVNLDTGTIITSQVA